MNCKHVQELLPLYVGGDLEEKRARLIAAHLQCCALCAGSANEYHEAQQLLQDLTPPSFGESVYAGIRGRVLREIATESNQPSLPDLVAGLFRPRVSWAVATMLLLTISLFVVYFITNRGKERRQIADVHPTASPRKPDATAPSSPSKVPRRNEGMNTADAGSGRRTRPSPPSKHVRTPALALSRPAQSSIPDAASAVARNPGERNAIPARDQAAAEKMLRVEIQTKDPNIRIIWFSQPRTKQDSPAKFSKGV